MASAKKSVDAAVRASLCKDVPAADHSSDLLASASKSVDSVLRASLFQDLLAADQPKTYYDVLSAFDILELTDLYKFAPFCLGNCFLGSFCEVVANVKSADVA